VTIEAAFTCGYEHGEEEQMVVVAGGERQSESESGSESKRE
jgi:hypothetical protein